MTQEQNKTEQRKPNPKPRKRTKNTKPVKYREFEKLAKSILEGKGVSYYKWLHEKHKELIIDFNVSNTKQIAELAREGD